MANVVVCCLLLHRGVGVVVASVGPQLACEPRCPSGCQTLYEPKAHWAVASVQFVMQLCRIKADRITVLFECETC